MIMTPYFGSEEIENIINNPKDLKNFFENNSVNGNGIFKMDDMYEDEGEEYEESENDEENDVENMSDKEKVKLAYEILSMTSYEDEFFIGILGRLRKVMRQ
jgi:hypothetical protein